MHFAQLQAQNFRNLSPDPVFFGAGMTVLAGENAQGKTNLLEAVALLCGQRSFRRGRPADMAAGPGGFRLSGKLVRGVETETLGVEWSGQGGRVFRRSGKPVSFREVSRLVPAVFLAPDHRELLTGAPGVRRRFLDRLVLGTRPAAGDDLARYERAVKSRNALLFRLRQGTHVAAGELEAWTEELVLAGAAVRRHRQKALAEWQPFFRLAAEEAGREYSAVSVSYVSDADSEEDLRKALEAVLPAERRRGHSLAGPHRDELAWTRHGRPFASQASAGEVARTVTLVKLSEWKAVRAASGEMPLLGVDDFDAGLSGRWIEAFFDALPEGAMVILTTASDPTRWRRQGAEVLEVRSGTAHPALPLRAVGGR